jgi:hypothetical protein
MAADRLRHAKHADAKGHVMNQEKEPGAALLAISQEFGKSVDSLLTGQEHAEQRKRAAKDAAGLG